ncbi:hypothetical protein CL618_03450 [archaeon]|nr:hypothetical protein [archaeon]|tara:strand:- start:3815 stop:4639 length:825 start_codon:yes stop_codon:yes gene_type:complete
MSLTEQLNKGYELPIKPYTGPIPLTIPAIKLDGRTPADGDYILKKRLEALHSQDKERITTWCNHYFDTPDLIATLEDEVKFQPNSPFLIGIQGIVDNQVVIDAEVLAQGVTDIDLFGEPTSTQATYSKDGQETQHTVGNVILLSYNGISISLTPEQFQAIKTESFKRPENTNRDLPLDQIIEGDQVIHPIWSQYDPETILPLTEAIFAFAKTEYGFDTNMGLWLPEETDPAELRAACLGRLGVSSWLGGNVHLGVGYACLLGVANVAEGDAKKI